MYLLHVANRDIYLYFYLLRVDALSLIGVRIVLSLLPPSSPPLLIPTVPFSVLTSKFFISIDQFTNLHGLSFRSYVFGSPQPHPPFVSSSVEGASPQDLRIPFCVLECRGRGYLFFGALQVPTNSCVFECRGRKIVKSPSVGGKTIIGICEGPNDSFLLSWTFKSRGIALPWPSKNNNTAAAFCLSVTLANRRVWH
jgi:hypothetical protein